MFYHLSLNRAAVRSNRNAIHRKWNKSLNSRFTLLPRSAPIRVTQRGLRISLAVRASLASGNHILIAELNEASVIET
jgi:hypothetical protein